MMYHKTNMEIRAPPTPFTNASLTCSEDSTDQPSPPS